MRAIELSLSIGILGLFCCAHSVCYAEIKPEPTPVASPQAVSASPPPKLAKMFIPAPAPTEAELRARLNGLTLPDGFEHRPEPSSPAGDVAGGINGPDNLEINYTISPTSETMKAPDQTAFTSAAARLKAGKHQWSREQYVGDTPVQVTLAADNTLAVSYPDLGINLSCTVKSLSQLPDALVAMLSITNKERRLSWNETKALLAKGNVSSFTMLHTGKCFVHTTDQQCFQALVPSQDELRQAIKAAGKEGQIGIAVD